MKQLSEEEFAVLQEGAAAAYLLYQRLVPWAKQRYGALDGDTKKLLTLAPEPIRAAYSAISQIAVAQDSTTLDLRQITPRPLEEIDVKTMRNELENVSAIVLPDLVYEMQCALEEMPMFREECVRHVISPPDAATMLAWAWEAGRRYGMIESISVFDTMMGEFTEQTTEVLERARDRNLDVELSADPNTPPVSVTLGAEAPVAPCDAEIEALARTCAETPARRSPQKVN